MGARSIPSVLTPAARIERATRLIMEGVTEAVKATLDQGNAVAEWVDQRHSPLGKRRHLELARSGRIPSKKHGQLVLIRREDLNAYIERAGLSRGKSSEEEEVVDLVERIEKRSRR